MSHSPVDGPLEAAATVKPMLRGYSHALATPAAVVATLLLLRSSQGHPGRQLSLGIYGTTLVLLFAGSATYHIGRWRPAAKRLLQRFDHGNIFLVIAGTYTPVAVALLVGSSRVLILTVVWLLAVTGAVISLLGLEVPRGVLAGLYIGVGWVAIFVAPAIYRAVGVPGSALILGAGLVYTLGALCYAFRWPDPWRRVFGFHEVFHLMVIAASALFVTFMALYVAPRG
ncbi:MAG: hemolysin III family protein [Candidatus Dormibacteraeota bacterium]|nr:hemolysin III family protein [Candidatus Dormibacteraeota bacterium]